MMSGGGFVRRARHREMLDAKTFLLVIAITAVMAALFLKSECKVKA